MTTKDNKASNEANNEDVTTSKTGKEPNNDKPHEVQKVGKPAKEKGGFSVYLGPTIRNTIMNGTIYKTDKAATIGELKEVIDEHPLVKTLIVRGSELSASRLKVKEPGSLLYENYKKLADSLQ